MAYEEDIYVGYRYFETVPGAASKVNYCFGYGLSYTEFEIRFLQAQQKGEDLFFDVCVTNVGRRAGEGNGHAVRVGPSGQAGKAGQGAEGPSRRPEHFRPGRCRDCG